VSRVDLHPEELLDRARSGTASKEELSRARAHMANCAACRIEQTLLVEIERSTATQPGDHLVAARIRTFVARAVEERTRAGAGLGKRRTARKWAAVAFAATLLLTTMGAAAMMLRGHWRKAAEQATNAAMAATLPRPPLAPQDLAGAEHSPPAEEAKDQPEKTIDKANDEAPGMRAPQRPPRATVKAEHAKAVDESAAELFTRANLLRRRDEVSEAAGVYRELQRSFPGSAEELLSRVVLGRLLLDRLGDPTAALAQFESYLAGASQGSLREEALVGRAVALGRLGRVTDERNAWNALLDAFPRSTSAARARARIAALAAP
jgi:TolA-binding protein